MAALVRANTKLSMIQSPTMHMSQAWKACGPQARPLKSAAKSLLRILRNGLLYGCGMDYDPSIDGHSIEVSTEPMAVG